MFLFPVKLNLEIFKILFVCFFQGFPPSLYVVEITVFPWKKQQLKIERGRIQFDLHPVYEDEEGKCHFRRQASLVQVS